MLIDCQVCEPLISGDISKTTTAEAAQTGSQIQTGDVTGGLSNCYIQSNMPSYMGCV